MGFAAFFWASSNALLRGPTTTAPVCLLNLAGASKLSANLSKPFPGESQLVRLKELVILNLTGLQLLFILIKRSLLIL
jgi:hypothetical protein